jgi:hypothetical protein
MSVDISTLTETAVKRQKDFKMLPYAVLAIVLGLHGIKLYPGVQNKDVLTEFHRKSGIMKPYDTGVAITQADIAKTSEVELEVKTAYASVKDNIKNYQSVSVGPGDLLGANKTKKHPWEVTMISSVVKTFGEDIIDALFPAARDTLVQTPQGSFDGFDTRIDTLIATAAITTALGNLVNTGTIAVANATIDNGAEPDTYTFAADEALLSFWRAAHPQLRQADSLLLVPYGIGDMYDDAYFAKTLQKPIVDTYNRAVLHGTGGKCKIVRSTAMGTGQRVMLIVPGLLHFGMNTLGDEAFVQVRNPYEDPNLVQFWIQGDYGTRIASVHEKVFQVNEGAAVANALSGDYDS